MVGRVDTPVCPDCGTCLDSGPLSTGLCPRCLLELALEMSPVSRGDPSTEDGVPTLDLPIEAFSPGHILGKRYQIRSLLGRGGMGEVWRALDLKLRVDVALKALRPQLLEDEQALELLRDEVRSAREVISPNVCRVFDLVELDGQELVSMEYIDGITLLDVLKMRSPLDLIEARELAAQFLTGLEAIHQAGLVHRDMKPENIMITRSGRVVVMDFGIAKSLAEGKAGTVSGTPAYMAPEQARGEAVNARADVFSAGVVLAEMIAPEGLATHEARAEVWKGIHHEPPQLPDSPWASVLKKAVAHIAEQRYVSAAALARALEEVTLRVEGAEHIQPYPGLSAFTEKDVEYFFGRELEVEAMWKKLRRPHLLGLIGPSGAGKSSFLRAGLLPVMPTGWKAVIATPGNRPFTMLGQALVEEFAGDSEATKDLLRFEELDIAVELVSRWRQQHDQALIVIDQFEELFTQNTAEVQGRFAELLGRLALESDAHVLVSMRDDFLFYCSGQEALSPMFSELTPLRPPAGAALRRAVVQPALKCGYRFEDESLVEEIVGEVSDERGALPMLAFAASRLWDNRDREQGLLTREAYEHIGGVGGALAQHAEATLERIGQDHIPIVRELFRNLVTAQGTRAARDRDELLSVFGDDGSPGSDVGEGLAPSRRDSIPQVDVGEGLAPSRGDGSTEALGPRAPARGAPTTRQADAAEILDALIDARLLTSYEVPGAEDEESAHHRIEIIHESLLTAWPRLVRWQTQDADSVQLRDQLRQAAQMWEERGRPEDLLWTGTSFGEYQLWRDRYEGGLSDTEETFAGAMITKAQRRRRRRRMAVSAAFLVLLAVLGIIGGFWRQAEQERRSAEASKLLALGQLELDRDPTIALAYALASLELADSPATRRFALKALGSGPAYFSLPPTGSPPVGIDFSPDERWLAVAYGGTGDIHIWSRAGSEAGRIQGRGGVPRDLRFSAESNVLVSAAMMDTDYAVRVWSVPEGEPLLVADGSADTAWRNWVGIMPAHLSPDGGRLITYLPNSDFTEGRIQSWPLDGARPQDLGVFVGAAPPWAIDHSGEWLLYRTPDMNKGEIKILPVAQIESANPRVVAHYEKGLSDFGWDFHDQRFAFESGGEIHVLSVGSESTSLVRSLRAPATVWAGFRFDESGSLLAAAHDEGVVSLWDLSGPAGADPLTWRYPSENDVDGIALQASGRWLAATNDEGGVRLWPIGQAHPWVLKGHRGEVRASAFAPDGTWIASRGLDGLRYWPLTRELDEAPWGVPAPNFGEFAFDPAGRFMVFAPADEQVRLLSMGGGNSRTAPAPEQRSNSVAVSSDSGFVAWGGRVTEEDRVIHVWDLETDEVRVLDSGRGEAINLLEFTPDGRLLAAYGPLSTASSNSLGSGPLRRWNVEEGTQEIFMEDVEQFTLSRDGRFLLTLEGGHVLYHDLQEGRATELPGLEADGNTTTLALDPTATIAVTGSEEGVLRVAPVTGGEPHLLMGHEASVYEVAVSPDGLWIASASADATIRLWPMPEGRPFHTMPYDELLAKLRSLTNLRVVRDSESSTGWKVEISPFPGWEEVPTW